MARKPMDVQSVIVDASRYSLEEAKAKVKKMGYKVTKVDKPEEGETQEHYRFRQRDPGQFEKFRYHKLKRKTKDGEEETGVQLVLAKSVHLLVKAVGHKYLRRILTPTGWRYIYQEHPTVKQAVPKVEQKGSPAAQRLASVIRSSHSAVGKHISAKAHDAVVAAKFHGKRRAKEHLDKIEQVHAEHKKKLGAAIEDAREKGKITHAEAMRLRKYQDKHGGSLANAIERLKGLIRDPKAALAQKSFHLVKAAGAGRPHKYVKRIAKPGGGFRYVYAEPAGERKHTRAQKIFNLLRDARNAHKAGDKEKADASIKMAYEESIKRNAETMKEISERQRTGKMTAEGAAAARKVIEDGTRRIGDKIRAVESEIKKPVVTMAPRAKVRGKEMSTEDARHALNHKMMVVEQHIRRNEFTDALKESDRMEDITQAFRGVRGANVIPWENKIYNLRWKAEEKKRKVAEAKSEQMIAEFKERAVTKKSFTEENMKDELSLSEREGIRIAEEVLGGEEAAVERMIKAVTPENGKSEKQEHAMAANLVNKKFGKDASVKQEKPGVWAVLKGGKVYGRGKTAMAAYKAALKSKAQKSFSTPRSAEEIAVAAALEHGPDALVKAARGGKYLKRIPKPEGGYRYVYEEKKELTDEIKRAHDKVGAQAKKEAKAGNLKRAKALARHAHSVAISRAYEAQTMGKISTKQFRELKRYVTAKTRSLLPGAQKTAMRKSIEARAVEAAIIAGGGPRAGEALAKAVLEVPVHGKTKKKTIPDERLLAIFRAHVRTEYRNASRYNEGTNAQSIYDRILSSAEYHHYVEAALGVLEKRKTPFSVDFVKQCIQEIEDAQKEAENVAPETTEPASVVASGG